ncbi:MAG: 50S ribosomal protein L21 [Anaerolineales bacterium]
MAYAVVESGGKQYVAREGEIIDVDRIKVDVGSEIVFDQILLTAEDGDVRVGAPLVDGASVTGKVIGQVKGPKILVFHYKPKVRYRKRQGHRQQYTRVTIDSIKFPGGKASGKSAKQAAPASEAKPKPTDEAKVSAKDIDLGSMLKADLEKMAEELGVMPEKGSGAGGNVLVKDLREAIEKALKD